MKQKNLVVFVKRNFFVEEELKCSLREYLMSNPDISMYSMITGVSDGKLDVKEPPLAFADAHLDDLGLCTDDAQAVYDGFLKTTLESLRYILGIPE